MSFAGMRVLSLESRRALEMAQLIRNQQGEPGKVVVGRAIFPRSRL